MPPKIVHDDGFEIWLSHQHEYLTIYDSVDVSDSSVHEGHFAGVLNKTFIQRNAGPELIMMQLVILRDFDFLSGDAVQFKLEIDLPHYESPQELSIPPIFSPSLPHLALVESLLLAPKDAETLYSK